MANCPDCGNIIMEGDPYCSHCGAQLVWSYDDEDEPSHQEYHFLSDSGNPYEDELLNGLMKDNDLRTIVPELSYSIGQVKKETGMELFDVTIVNIGFILHFKEECEYYDVFMDALFDVTQLALHKIAFDPYDINGDFTKLYDNSDFKKLIEKTEQNNSSTFLNCKLHRLPGAYLVEVFFDDKTYYLNLDKMEFAQ